MILGIYGAGGGGREFFELARDINSIENRWKSVFFIDDFPKEKTLRNCPVYTFEEMISKYSSNDVEITLAVGQPNDRKKLYDKVTSNGYRLATLVHPTAVIMENTVIGSGSVISRNVIISCDAEISENVLVLPMVTMGNNCRIGSHSVISPHSAVCASVSIGTCVYLAVHTCIRESTSVGNNVIVSAGSAVLKDMGDDLIVQGNPARAILKNTTGEIYKR